MKAKALCAQPDNLAHAQKVLNDWRRCYNELRPHTALNMKAPASVYTASTRSCQSLLEYVYDSSAKMVKVNNWGYLRFEPIQLFLSETMKDTYLKIRHTDSDTFQVIYRN